MSIIGLNLATNKKVNWTVPLLQKLNLVAIKNKILTKTSLLGLLNLYNGAVVMFLFKDGGYLIIDRLLFSSSKNVLLKQVRILKSSKNVNGCKIAKLVYGAILKFIFLFHFKDGRCLIIDRFPFSSSKNFLFKQVRILKSSKNAEWLQNIKNGLWSYS